MFTKIKTPGLIDLIKLTKFIVLMCVTCKARHWASRNLKVRVTSYKNVCCNLRKTPALAKHIENSLRMTVKVQTLQAETNINIRMFLEMLPINRITSIISTRSRQIFYKLRFVNVFVPFFQAFI